MKNKNYCKDCPDRYIGCHSMCERYKAFREELDELNEKIYKAKERERDIDRYEREMCERNKRRRN